MRKIEQGGVRIEQQAPGDMLLVEGYGDGGFKLKDRRIKGAVLVTRTGFYPVPAVDVASLSAADLDQFDLMAEKPELLLLGTGAKMTLVPSSFRATVEDKCMALEFMDTGAAARTYNILLLEDRRVAALLLPVD